MVTKSANINLHRASVAKNDEFYTQLEDIAEEVKHYKTHFADKVVYCNCDDPRISEFFFFFASHFKDYKLKKLITTCYKNQNPDLFSRHDSEQAICLEYDGGTKEQGKFPIGIKPLKGDGDFRSPETIEFLKETDIVVTNPPFSLFREYVAQLIEYDKKFIIIGNKNAITYKEIFKLIKENKLWVGNMSMSLDLLFDVPKHFADELVATKKEGSAYRIINGVVKGRSQAIWFTNLDIKKRSEILDLTESYERNKAKYPKYDNYNAINVDRTVDIPKDYSGVMGVPISFLDKYNPNQFEIIGFDYEIKQGLLPELINNNWDGKIDRGYIDGKRLYARILVKNKNLEK